MPRLPNIDNRRGVQSLGRENLSAPLRLARTEALAARNAGRTVQAGIDTVGRWKDREDEKAVEEALVEYEKRRGEWMAQMTQQRFYAPDEVPDELQVQRTRMVTDEFGRTREIPRDMIPAEELAVGLYDMRMSGLHEQILANLSNDKQRRAFSSRADMATVRGRNIMLEREQTFARESLRDSRLATIEELAKAEKWDEAIELIDQTSPEVLSERERTRLTLEIQERRVTQPIYDAKARQDQDALEAHLQVLTDPDVPMPGVSTQRRAQLAADVQTDINAIVAAKEAQLREFQRGNASTYRGMIHAGDPRVGQDTVNQAFEHGKIDIHQWATLTGMLNENRGKVDNATLVRAWRGGPLPANDPRYRKGADAIYEDLQKRYWSEGTPEGEQLQEFTAAAGALLRRWQTYVPQGMQNSLFSLMHSADSKDVEAAVTLYNSMMAGAPYAVHSLGDKFANIHRMATLQRYGWNGGRIAEHMRGTASLTEQQLMDARAGFDREMPPVDAEKWVADRVGDDDEGLEGLFGRDPAASGTLSAEVRARARYHRPFMPDAESAMTAGWRDVMGQYDATEIDGGGRRLQPYALERVFGKESMPLVRADIDRQLSAIVEGTEPAYTHSDVILHPAPQSSANYALGGVPFYRVFDADTMETIYRPDGTPFYYVPDLARTREAAIQERAIESGERRQRIDTLREDIERAEALVRSGEAQTFQQGYEQAERERAEGGP